MTKNSKNERKLSAKKWRSGEVLMNSFSYKKKSNQQQNIENNICASKRYLLHTLRGVEFSLKKNAFLVFYLL